MPNFLRLLLLSCMDIYWHIIIGFCISSLSLFGIAYDAVYRDVRCFPFAPITSIFLLKLSL